MLHVVLQSPMGMQHNSFFPPLSRYPGPEGNYLILNSDPWILSRNDSGKVNYFWPGIEDQVSNTE